MTLYDALKYKLHKLDNILTQNTNYSFGGLNQHSEQILSALLAMKAQHNIVIIANTDKQANDLYKLIANLGFDKHIHLFPSYGFDFNIPIKNQLELERISTINSLLYNPHKKSIVVTSYLGFLQKTVPSKVVNANSCTLIKNQSININEFLEFLVNSGYQKVNLVTNHGEFALRGDIIDIIVAGIGALRIDLFDNTIENIRIFDTDTQKTLQYVEDACIYQSREVVINKDTIQNFKNSQVYSSDETQDLLNNLEQGITTNSYLRYVHYFYNDYSLLSDFINEPTFILFNGYHIELKKCFNLFSKQLLEASLEQEAVFDKILSHSTTYSFEQVTHNFKKQHSELNISSVKLMFYHYKSRTDSYIQAVIDCIKDNQQYNFIICYVSDKFAEDIQKAFISSDIDYSFDCKHISANVLMVKETSLEEGFIIEDIVLITQQDISGDKITIINKPKLTKKKVFMQHLRTIEAGDIIVHRKHGFGKYIGLKTLFVNNADHDFLEILYKNDEKLYVPVEHIELVSLYGEDLSNVILDKLGSSAFANKRKKAQEKMRAMAYDLLQIAAQRKLIKAPVSLVKKEDYQQFSERFPYTPTLDQQAAINDIIYDLTSGHPSDRLVCGDVGFGKTEVAMRAIFMMIQSGYQVAFIAPTTLLCQQHYESIKARFVDYSITVGILSRLVTNKKKQVIKEKITKAEIDIVVGTHALLSSNVKFANLALIIIDEEQNFGVLHKEKLKALATKSHIITLSATPIPRTIQMAFKGMKDLSIIATPPKTKLPINTYVIQYDKTLIKQAIINEITRGGQVFFVMPKISDLKEVQGYIEEFAIDLSYKILHGQMKPEDIENTMQDFQDGKYEVLISTNIIESGLDLHNVNTIIIGDAHMFGLSQLYQLRGRVGRGEIEAFAYLFFQDPTSLTEKAKKRLQIIQELDYLGASFTLSSYDLELRGSGNLLGKEQSGHMKEMGADLYYKLLQQEINYAQESSDGEIKSYYFNPDIIWDLPVYIPRDYIADIEICMEIYQRLGKTEYEHDIPIMKNELLDRFGKLPDTVDNLLLLLRLKIISKQASIEKIVFGKLGVILNFYKQYFPNVHALLDMVHKDDKISLRKEGLFLHIETEDTMKQVDEVICLISNLKKIIKESSL